MSAKPLDPFMFSDSRECLSVLLERLPCGEILADAWVKWILSDPVLIERLELNPEYRAKVESYLWVRTRD